MNKKITRVLATTLAACTLLSGPAFAISDWTNLDSFQVQGISSDGVYTGLQSFGGQDATEPTFTHASFTASELVSITEEPEDIVVSYPESASFHVGVDHPENVASYEWSYGSGSYSVTPTTEDSRSQGKDTFEIPSTYADTGPLWFSCTITDTAGGKVFTRGARLTIANSSEEKPLVYVGDQVVRPGETYNLADDDYGSGTVSFNDEGTDVTLNNVQMNNPRMISDWRLANTQGILLVDTRFYVNPYAPYDPSKYEDLPEEYHITVNGENTIVSKHFDSVGSGNIFQAYFAAKNNPDFMPRVFLEGDGKLNLDGGSFNYYSDAKLNLGVDISGKSNDLTYTGDGFGVQAVDIVTKEGSTFDFDVHSAAFNVYSEGVVEGNLVIGDGVTINATSNPGNGGPMTGNSILSASNEIIATNATINLDGTVFADRFIPISDHKIHHFIGIAGPDGVTLDNCDVNIDMASETNPDGEYVANIFGIKSNSNTQTLITNDSSVNIQIDAPDAVNVSAINTLKDVTIDNNSNVNINISGAGENVYGIQADGALNIVDANIDVAGEGHPYVDPGRDTLDKIIGIFGRPVSIDFTDDTHHVYSKTNHGAAFMGADTSASPISQEIPGYDPAYTPAYTSLKNLATIITPTNAAISSYGFSFNGNQVQLGEAIYDLTDTSAPAKEVLIATAKSDAPSVPNSGAESKKNDSSAVETSLSVIVVAAALSLISLYHYQSKKTRK